MPHINTGREKRIDQYTRRTLHQNAPTLQSMTNNLFGDTQHYVSGQDIQEAHQSGMEQYANQLARDTHQGNLHGIFYYQEHLDHAIDEEMRNSNGEIEYESRITALTRQEQFYFRSSERSLAKVRRYQNLSQNARALESYTGVNSNRSVSKRVKKARDAAKAYKKVANLQLSYDKELEKRNANEQAQNRGRRIIERGEWRAQNLADYNRLEEITRARIQAMTYAVQARSIRKDQENFSIQKGTLKNLLVLRDCLNRLLIENPETAEINKLRAKQVSLNKEIKKVSDKIDSLDPGSNSWITYI